MLSNEVRDSILVRGFWTLRIIWVSMLSSVLTFGGVLLIILPSGGGSSEVSSELSVQILYFVAAFIGVSSLSVRKFLTPRLLRIGDRAAEMAFSGDAPQNEAERAAKRTFFGYQTAMIVAWAMSESVAIFGMVLSILTQSWTHFAILGAVSFGLIAFLHAPSKELIEGALRRLESSAQL